jgi:hypothetical protein
MNLTRLVSRTLTNFPPPLLNIAITAMVGTVLSVTPTHAQSGTPVWTNRISGPESLYAFPSNPVAVDTSGNVIVTGPSIPLSGFGDDYLTIKYSSAGVPLWTNRYDGPVNGYDTAVGVAVDGDDNVFVTGTSAGSGNCDDFATIKYSSAGVPLWTNRYDSPGNGCETAIAVAVSSNGNVYVTGSATIAYSNLGEPLWTNVNGSGIFLSALATDSSNNVFVTGSSSDGGKPDFVTLKYSSTGVALWTNRYDEPNYGYDAATSVAVDGDGNVFVTGRSTGSHNAADYATIKYSNAGLPLWTNRYNGTGDGYDEPAAVAVDSSGNVFVTGVSRGNDSSDDYLTIKYSNAGVPLWTNRYNGPGNGSDAASALVVDRSGNIYVTGKSDGINYNIDYATIAYSNAGVPLWTNRYDGAVGGFFSSTDFANGVALDTNGNVYVTGYSDRGSSIDGNNYIVTIKYAALTSGSALFPIPLNFHRLDNQLVLSWTNAAFGLQSSPLATGVFTNIPGAASPYTNSLTDDRQFFRLKDN